MRSPKHTEKVLSLIKTISLPQRFSVSSSGPECTFPAPCRVLPLCLQERWPGVSVPSCSTSSTFSGAPDEMLAAGPLLLYSAARGDQGQGRQFGNGWLQEPQPFATLCHGHLKNNGIGNCVPSHSTSDNAVHLLIPKLHNIKFYIKENAFTASQCCCPKIN